MYPKDKSESTGSKKAMYMARPIKITSYTLGMAWLFMIGVKNSM